MNLKENLLAVIESGIKIAKELPKNKEAQEALVYLKKTEAKVKSMPFKIPEPVKKKDQTKASTGGTS